MRVLNTGVLVAVIFATSGIVSATGPQIERQSPLLPCLAGVDNWKNRLPGAAAAQADCSAIEAQLDRDKKAMQRQHDSILDNSDELEEWDKANQDALRDAAKDAAKLTLGKLAKVLQGKQKALQGLQDEIVKNMYRRGSTINPEYAANVARQLQEANRAYDRVKSQVALGNVLNTGTNAHDIWEMVNKTITAVADAQGQADSVVNAALKDPALSSLFEADHAASEFRQKFAEMAMEAARISPHVDVAAFVVDTAYNAEKWRRSRERILQQVELSEKNLQAVNALKAQIERTVNRLQQCRADVQPAQQKPQPTAQPSVPQLPQVPAPPPEPPNSGNGGGNGSSNVGKIVGYSAAGVGAAVGGKMLADYAESVKCTQYETEMDTRMTGVTNAANSLLSCGQSLSCVNSRQPALNNALSAMLTTAGNWCTCLGPSAAAELTAADKALVRGLFNDLRAAGISSGTLPACFR